MDWRPNAENDRLALTILAGFVVARFAFAFSLGLGVDESYTIAISRRLSLSYFDHPPLHLWIAHFTALAAGENVVTRAPFVVLFFATGWIYYRLTSGLFDPQSALIALFALNVTPFFFASAGGWIVPDGPLLFGLALAALAAARLFFAKPQDDASAWRLWLIVGVGLGLAGLSKYSAMFSAGGLAAFVIVSPNRRHWLKHPAPYVDRDRRAGDDNSGHPMERPARLGVVGDSGRPRPSGRRTAAGAIHDHGPRPNRVSVALDIRAAGRGPGERYFGNGRTSGAYFCFASASRRLLFSPLRLRFGADAASRIGQCRVGSSPSP